jgi:hypothetical protein
VSPTFAANTRPIRSFGPSFQRAPCERRHARLQACPTIR